nr:chromosome segregation protein SMC [uncultured Peptostreptococcus sp.]
MYLKKLELKGFKSFPTKTDIYFDKGVTTIVGPNGSGKSNISDAIRWVLGEQSIKSLRGEKMEDVIFQGTDTKKQMNYCEVAISLDNSQSEIDIDSEELIIRRRVYRSGESLFYINDKTCRLKDVREILLDTGIGKDGYSIIEQGKVEEILSNNPANRRKIFDEACGISKFRYKKNEAERNLKKSSDNLARIEDIFYEIENQLKPLQNQSKKAEKYLVVSEELKKLELNDFIRQTGHMDKSIRTMSDELLGLDKELDLISSERLSIESQIQELDASINESDSLLEELNSNLIDINDGISSKKNEIQISQEKINSQLRDISRKESEMGSLESSIKVDKMELDKVKKDLDKISYEIEESQKELDKAYDNKRKAQVYLESVSEEMDLNKAVSIDILEKKQDLSTGLAKSQANMDNLKNAKTMIEARLVLQADEIEKLQKYIEEKNKEASCLATTMEDLDKDLDQAKNKLASLQTSIELVIKNDRDLNMDLGRIKSRRNTYIDMENHHEGFNKGVKEILKNKSIEGICGALGELISLPAKYEKAIEASLGAAIQNVVVENEDVAKKSIDYLKKSNLGRVTFLPKTSMRSNKLSLANNTRVVPLGLCSEIVDFDDEYRSVVESLLGRVILIDNMTNAIAYAKETGHRFKLVTLDGDILNPGGSMTGGSLKASGNILSRKRLISELGQEIDTIEDQINSCKSEFNLLELEKKSQESQVSKITLKKEDLSNSIISINTELKLAQAKLKDRELECANNQEELSKLELDIEKNQEEYSSFKGQIEVLEEKVQGNQDQIQDLTEKLNKAKEEHDLSLKIFNDKNLDIVRIKQIFENKLLEVDRIENNIEKSQTHLGSLLGSIKENKEAINDYDLLIETYTSQVKDLDKAREDLSNRILDKKADRDDLRLSLDESKSQLRTRDRDFNELIEDKYKLEAKLDRSITSRDNLQSSILEKYSLSYDDALEYKVEDLVIDQDIIDNLRKKIRSMGNVNLDSIQEYEQVKERHDYYKEQKQDLEESIISLNSLINDLVVNMESEFLDNFDTINKNFVEVYKKLFGGGSAELRITDMEDILSCDIEIKAQPPGKKMKNLSLLSGGEKALTAISILFAILISKPTPFCILDEIEAPLDDVNVYRFGDFLKELSQDTQFIAVTHRRGTMEVADFIYGVTMQEKGISSIIGIKLKEAQEMVENS